MSKKLKVLLSAVGAAVVVVAILFNNRAHIAAKSKSDIRTTLPVSVATIERQSLPDRLSLVGTICAKNDVAIVAETIGKVTAVLAQVGDYRPAGSAIVQVDDEVKKAQFEQAEATYEKAKKDYDRFTSLRDEHAATESQKEAAWQSYKNSEAAYIIARRQYRDTKITTPISGVVSMRAVDKGSMVTDKMVVANVVDVSELKVKLNVAERDAFRLRTGDKVDVTTDVYPGITFAGKIKSISAKADEGHTYPVEITLENRKDHPLRSGMFGRVDFTSVRDREAIAVPREALIGSMKQPKVFVVSNNVARLRDLTVGGESGRSLLVLAGLVEGEQVVVSGQNNLKDSVAVEIVK